MLRLIIVLAAMLMFPTSANAQSRFLLKGKITDGESLFVPDPRPNPTWGNYGDPLEGYPIDYTARLNVFEDDNWSFNFTANSADREATHFIESRDRPSLGGSEETLSITLGSGLLEENFDLFLEFQTSRGEWRWSQDCFACFLAYPLPGATATVTAIEFVPIPDGDFNNDGLWDQYDIDALMVEIATGDSASFDLNGDGSVSDSDRDMWLAEAGPRNGFASGYLLGDASLDGTVDATDLGAVGLNWRTNPGAGWTDGNFTGAGVNSADLNVLALNWRKSVPVAAPVPEPSGGVLFSGVYLGFLLLLRRKASIRFQR